MFLIRLPNPIRWPLTGSSLRDNSPSRAMCTKCAQSRDFAEPLTPPVHVQQMCTI